MKKWLALFLMLFAGKLYAEDVQFKGTVWRSSQIAANPAAIYNNVLLSSSPIVFHVLNGSATVNGGSSIGLNNYFCLFWSSSNPPASDMSTKAFISLNQSQIESSGLGYVWDTPILSTGQATPVYTFYSKQGGAGPLFIEYGTFKYTPAAGSVQDKFWKD